MSTTTTIQQLNRDLADKVLEDARRDPAAFSGRYVGIANGKVVVSTDDLDELGRRLEQAEPDAAKTFWVEIGRDYDKVCEIWEVA
jgi:hypothetical protein